VAPLLYRLAFDEDTIDTLHLKMYSQPYVKNSYSV